MRHTSSIDSPRLIIFLSLQGGEGEDGERPGGLLTGSTFPWKQEECRINIPMSHLQQAALGLCRFEVFLSHTYTHALLCTHTCAHVATNAVVIFFTFRIYDNFFNSKRNKCINRENLPSRGCPQHGPVLSADPEVRRLVLALMALSLIMHWDSWHLPCYL